jgi:hypothetical protein
MARYTRFIGLTKAAHEAVKFMKLVGQNRRITIGIGHEDIPGTIWRDESGKIWEEKVQLEPWNGGPMIFTHLVDSNGNSMFSWILNPSLLGEYDYEKGEYNV